MISSTDRIITSHVGSLPRPPELLKLIQAKAAGRAYEEEELAAEIRHAVEAITKRQADLGLDVISDGEMSKPSFLGYIAERLGGVRVTDEPLGNPWKGSRENNQYPEYYAWDASLGLHPAFGSKQVVCEGPLTYRGHREVATDVANFKAALAKVNVREAFLPAISPSNVEYWMRNEYYKSDEEYIFALADVMHEEYKAISDAGLLLQIDDPRLVTQYVLDANMSLEECRRWAGVRVRALNQALRGIPQEQIRFHTCYSIDMGPRTNDMEHKNIVDIILKVRAGAYSFEGANPRHEHEWKVWSHVKLPQDKILIPGVVTHFNRPGRASGIDLRSHSALRKCRGTREGHRWCRLWVWNICRQYDDSSERCLGETRCLGTRCTACQRTIVGCRRQSGIPPLGAHARSHALQRNVTQFPLEWLWGWNRP